MKKVMLYEEYLKEEDQKIEEDFAAVGTPPAGNVSGMGPVTAPTPGHVGSGDAWPSLGTPAVAIPVTSGICSICKKSKKACKCADSPSEKKKAKIKKIKANEMKHVTEFNNFLNEKSDAEKDYMSYMETFKKCLTEKVPGRHFTIENVLSDGSSSDDATGEGRGDGRFTLHLQAMEIEFNYDIEIMKDYGDETSDMKVHIQFVAVDAKLVKSYDHDLKKQSLPDFANKLKELVKEDLAKFVREY